MKKNIWTNKKRSEVSPPLSIHTEADAVVVGAGITGLTTAHQLVEGGKKVVVLEADTLSGSTTARSSAHLTTSVDYLYSGLASKHNRETTKAVADSRKTAIAFISQMAEHFPCDFKYVSGFLYSENEKNNIEEEYREASEAGLNVSIAQEIPLPFVVTKALEFHDQAIFHPYKYLTALAEFLKKSPLCEIYENSRVLKREKNTLFTAQGSVKAHHIIYATHYPVFIDMHQTMAYPYRSYLLAATVEEDIGDSLFWDTAEPYHYTRTYRDGDKRYLLVGGADHKTGHTKENAFMQLEEYLQQRYTLISTDFRWSSQFYEPADGLPYIGKSFSEGEFIGTGYSGDGLVYGTIAAILISNEIMGVKNEMWNGIYESKRLNLSKSAGKMTSQNVSVASHMVKDRLQTNKPEDVDDLEKGDGMVIKKDGHNIAVSRAADGSLHEISAVCPHLKCFVRWNKLDKTWDCPCHGSRFSFDGEVITGPAVTNLEKMNRD